MRVKKTKKKSINSKKKKLRISKNPIIEKELFDEKEDLK